MGSKDRVVDAECRENEEYGSTQRAGCEVVSLGILAESAIQKGSLCNLGRTCTPTRSWLSLSE